MEYSIDSIIAEVIKGKIDEAMMNTRAAMFEATQTIKMQGEQILELQQQLAAAFQHIEDIQTCLKSYGDTRGSELERMIDTKIEQAFAEHLEQEHDKDLEDEITDKVRDVLENCSIRIRLD